MLQVKQNWGWFLLFSLLAYFLWLRFGCGSSLPGHCISLPLEELCQCAVALTLTWPPDLAPANSSTLMIYLSLPLLYPSPTASRCSHMPFYPPRKLCPPSTWLTPSHPSFVSPHKDYFCREVSPTLWSDLASLWYVLPTIHSFPSWDAAQG